MELRPILNTLTEQMKRHADRMDALGARVEDLIFRAQRIAQAVKNQKKSQDITFAEDIQLLKRMVRAMGQEMSSLTGPMNSLNTAASADPAAVAPARGLLSVASGLARAVEGLLSQSRLLHNAILDPQGRVEAWYILQELEDLFGKVKGYPSALGTRIIPALAAASQEPDPPAA